MGDYSINLSNKTNNLVIKKEFKKKDNSNDHEETEVEMEVFDCQSGIDHDIEKDEFKTDKKLLTNMTDTNSKSEVRKLTDFVNKNMIQVMDELHDLESERENDRIVQNLFVKDSPGLFDTANFSMNDSKYSDENKENINIYEDLVKIEKDNGIKLKSKPTNIDDDEEPLISERIFANFDSDEKKTSEIIEDD